MPSDEQLELSGLDEDEHMSTTPTLIHGIRQCDSCTRALAWLRENSIEHRFVDLRADPLDEAMIAGWLEQLPVDQLLNRRSTTWRQLSEQEKARTDTAALLLEHPTLIKRPLLAHEGRYRVGFKADQWAEIFGMSG